MVFQELQPTTNNLIQTLERDSIGRTRSAIRLCQFLCGIKSGFSIALDNPWGGGKTFFVKQIKLILDAYNPFSPHSLTTNDTTRIKKVANTYVRGIDEALSETPYVTVYYDAWDNDNSSDPLLTLIYEIAHSINADFDCLKKPSLRQKISAIVELFTGKDIDKLLKATKSETFINEIATEKSLKELIAEFLEEVIQERGNRLLIILDELDRCKPSFAVALLERVKHYFSNEHVTFLFALNENALRHTISKNYGEQYDSSRYLDRFFDLTTSLPPVDLSAFYDYISLATNGSILDDICIKLVIHYKLSMREIFRFYNAVNAGAGVLDRQSLTKKYCTFFLFPVAVALRITDKAAYDDFINGKNCAAFLDFMQTALKDVDLSQYDLMLQANHETYNEPSNPRTKRITAEEKYTAVYNALFLQTYRLKDYRPISIGRLEFDNHVRESFFLQLGALSD